MITINRPCRRWLALATALLGMAAVAGVQGAAQAPAAGAPAKPTAPIERLGANLLRIGTIQVDTAKKEISVSGVVNDVVVLEFVANTKGGLKAYESAFELDTNAINFNFALILIGLDPARSVPPKFQFDPETPKGDPVEIWVEWTDAGKRRRERMERVVYNQDTKRTLAEGPWVYTSSVFMADSNNYLAEVDGTLIGFMHNASPIIESPLPLTRFGASIINPALGLKPGTTVQVTVRALPRK